MNLMSFSIPDYEQLMKSSWHSQIPQTLNVQQLNMPTSMQLWESQVSQ